ncbi:transposase [Streptococcus pneumoniae]|nr:transposase [Streptococcus pneumoniae]
MVNCEPLEAYRQLEEAELVGCWAHVRRKFFEAPPKQADKSSLGAKGLAYCDQLFSLERDWEALPADERLQKRQEHLQPLMEDFFAWCRRQSVLSGSKLGRAIEYSLKYEETFKTPLEAYRQLEEAELVGCWAHVRRKFFEAPPKQADKSSLGAKGLAYCD